GVLFTNNSDYGVLRNFSISDDNSDYFAGVGVADSNNVIVEQGVIERASIGIGVSGITSNDTVIRNIRMTRILQIGVNTGRGVVISQANNVQVTNVNISGAGAGGVIGVSVVGDALNARIGNVHVSNFATGYHLGLGANTTVIDLGGNTFTANGMQSACDGMNDISAMSGPLNVTTTNNGTVALCR
ncbi:MAG: hypothetical protein JNK86_07060, partial [Alphaproteobacteria bacterium]|nr:hypothetical protein [Alphaproteobacteria bacterium]